MTKVVDSWALLAWLLSQPAAPTVDTILGDASAGRFALVMSWINVGEVFYTAAKRHGVRSAEHFLTRLPTLPIRTVVPDESGILAAARIKAAHPVAFGDAFAISLAQAENASVITGDDEIRRCRLVPVNWVGA